MLLNFNEYSAFLLKEAFMNSDYDKAISLILNYLQKKCENLYQLPTDFVAQNDGKMLFGVHYIGKSVKCIRVIFLKGDNTKMDSIFVYDVASFDPLYVMEIGDESVALILPAVANLYNSLNAKSTESLLNQIDESMELDDLDYLSDDEISEVVKKTTATKKTTSKTTAKKPAKKTATKKTTVKKATKVKDMTPSTTKAEKEFRNVEYADVNVVFDVMEGYVEMILKKLRSSVLITGLPGVGKTYNVTKCIKSFGLQEIKPIDPPEDIDDIDEVDYEAETPGDWVHIKGSASPLGLYMALYKYKNKLLVFDDCDSVLRNKTALNILKGALDTSAERTISWVSSTTDKGVPKRFTFNGSIIFISNLYKDDLDTAIRSRSLVVDLTITAKDIIHRMKSILPDVAKDLYSMASKEKAIKKLEEFLKPEMKKIEISIRTLLMLASIYEAGLDGVLESNMIDTFIKNL